MPVKITADNVAVCYWNWQIRCLEMRCLSREFRLWYTQANLSVVSLMMIKKLSTLVAYVSVFILLSLVMDYWRGRALPDNHIPYDAYIDISGKPVDIKALSNNGLTVVYFWATWCGPCKVTSPSVKYLAKHYPVVSIALKSGEDDALTQYFNNTESVIPIVNDTDGAISKQWGVDAVPTVLFIKDKKILAYTMGASGYPGLLARAWLAQVFH